MSKQPSRTFIWDTKTGKILNVTSKFLSHMKARLLNMTWLNFKVQCLKVFYYQGNSSTILLFNSVLRTIPEVFGKLYFVEIG